jgi:O-acetyl-ADP-ribose deacetylase (regulator of RNase III)
MTKIELIQGDITKMEVDAIVNAANTSLLGGGGVDGAIHRAAGPELLEECKTLNGCKTGDAKITKGYNLLASYVIHTVGPVWHSGIKDEDKLLASCYRRCLEIAAEHKIKSIAFPNISTGVYRFPKDLAATIAIAEVKKFLTKSKSVKKVLFVAFDDDNHEIYANKL